MRRREDLDWHANAGERSPLSDVTLVALLDVDGALFSADFRRQSVSLSFTPRSLVVPGVRVTGRSGAANAPSGTSSVANVVYKGYDDFAEQALAERRMMQCRHGPAM